MLYPGKAVLPPGKSLSSGLAGLRRRDIG